MVLSIRRICVALLIVSFIAWLGFVCVMENWHFEIADLVMLVIWLLAVCIFVWTIAWSLGLTRFSSIHIRNRSIVVLNYLEQAVRMNLPLSRLLMAAEASERGWTGDRIGRLRKQLDKGSSVADALKVSVPGTLARTVSLIAAAERIGQLGPELTQLVQQAQDQQNRDAADRTFIRAYPVAMVISIVAIVSAFMTFVVPKFEQIFHGFHASLPPVTQMLVNFINLLNGPIQMMLFLGVMLLAGLYRQISRQWDLRLLERLFTSNRDLADICHVISRGLYANLPFSETILDASRLSIGGSMRRKLRGWANGIQNGQMSSDAADAVRLPKLIASLTTTAEGYEFLSRYYAGKFSGLAVLLRAAAIPALAFFFGMIVAFIAMALFLPLIALIDSVAPGLNPHASL